MRNYDEMLELILQTARADDRIRAVTQEGSNVTPGAVRDQYSDFDITFFVSDIREFTNDRDYMNRFGEILILQRPDDWYEHPYDYNGRENYALLTQYKDGNRIDLTLVDVSNIKEQTKFTEPRTVLINKDDYPELVDIPSSEMFYITKPDEFEFFNTCNEFRWVSIYVTKGLCRRELNYAKRCMDVYMMDMFLKMLNWKVGIEHDFQVTTGANAKYLKKYLSEEEMRRFSGIFANGEYEDMWEKLFLFYDYFTELSVFVGGKLGFVVDLEETHNVRDFLELRRRGNDV